MHATVVRILFLLLSSSILLFSGGCVTGVVPSEEWTLARSAIESARIVDSAKYSAANFNDAEKFYQQAQLKIQEKEYQLAKDLFIKARMSAEKAENSARFTRFKNGEVL